MNHLNGDYDREHESVEDRCDQCFIVLVGDERVDGRCRMCEQDALDAANDERGAA